MNKDMTVEEWLGEGNQLGIDIWERKYRQNGESFPEWIDRVSGGDKTIARLILEKKFLFGGRILSNRGLCKDGIKSTLSNCYVIAPPEDNIESIFECAQKLARTFSYGGGCGVDISNLAPAGAAVNNTAKQTSGAVSFMDLYSMVTGLIGQNGRRGALMISIDCSHPDVENFIKIKSDLDKVTKANISVRISDDFMNAVKTGGIHKLKFHRPESGETIERDVDARELFNLISQMNWDYAEPGALFWDRINGWNLLSNVSDFSYAGVNPCAEEPLPAGGSCLLGSINLSEFVIDPFTEKAKFDSNGFIEAVKVSTRALNVVLDEGLSLHPLAEQRESVERWRQIGLGIFGMADMLIKLGIKYGEAKAVTYADDIGKMMINAAMQESSEIAKELGSFSGFDATAVISSPFFVENATPKTKDMVEENGLRNSQILTIAPTGTISTMLGVSGGVEPIFANYYERKTESLHGHDEAYKVYTPIVKEYMESNGIRDDEELPEYFVTAQTLDYHKRIAMQAALQRHIDASISSTVNVPCDFTVEDTERLYMEAWEYGLKGITIFRAGCKRGAILTTEPQKMEPEAPQMLGRGDIVECSDDLVGKKRKLTSGCGSLHCLTYFDTVDGSLQEVYLSKGSTGGCLNFTTGLSRMISLLCRAGVDVYTIKDQLDSTGVCPSYATRSATKRDTSKGSCCPVAIGNAIVEMYEEMQDEVSDGGDNEMPSATNKKVESDFRAEIKTSKCPECGETLRFEGGCNSCPACGWSKCG